MYRGLHQISGKTRFRNVQVYSTFCELLPQILGEHTPVSVSNMQLSRLMHAAWSSKSSAHVLHSSLIMINCSHLALTARLQTEIYKNLTCIHASVKILLSIHLLMTTYLKYELNSNNTK